MWLDVDLYSYYIDVARLDLYSYYIDVVTVAFTLIMSMWLDGDLYSYHIDVVRWGPLLLSY